MKMPVEKNRTYLSLLGLIAVVATVASQEYIESIECPFPEGQTGQNQTECERYTACEWTEEECHMKTNSEIGYRVLGTEVPTNNGFTVFLEAVNPAMTLFGGDIKNLVLRVTYHSEQYLQIKITDADQSRYEVPASFNLPPPSNISSPNNYRVNVRGNDDQLVISVVRTSNGSEDGNIIFRQAGPLTFEDQFIQFTTRLASTDLFGFGENYHDTFRHQFEPRVTQAIFTRGTDLTSSNENYYGAHPYHMVMEDEVGNAHSILMLNSNAMEYSTFMMDKVNKTKPALTCRTIGGVLDLHFFMGPTPEEVNQQYLSVIGKPLLPPYYALGFHLSRWGYTGTNDVRQVQIGMRNAMIPQDVQVFDIDYMDGYRDFTVDPSNSWSDLPELINDMKEGNNIYSTVIIDPAVSTEFSSYLPAQRGVIAEAYIKWAEWAYVPPEQPAGASKFMVGNVFPDAPVVFPDFLHADTQDWWIDEIGTFYKELKFDSIWTDMNEPSNLDTNQAGKLNCPRTKWDDPPYPTIAVRWTNESSGRLSDQTICMSTVHDLNGVQHWHYNVHSLYGWSQAEPSYRAMLTARPGKRPFILSRSTYPGSGQYAIHWLGDNFSTWDDMRKSIIGLFEFNMFGIPFVGADVCGFNGDTTEELCARWTQLGAFYPFNRNHNSIGSIAQDPPQWSTVANIARIYYDLRYQYNPYLYLLLHFAHMHGETVVRPLLNVFPSDVAARDVEDQFLWGEGLMVAPVLMENTTTRSVYFPMSQWYDIQTGFLVSSGNQTVDEVAAPLEVMPVYVRGGYILPWQDVGQATSTTETRLNHFGLTVALDENDSAYGQIFWDDGESDYESPMMNSFMASIEYSDYNLTMSIMHGNEYVEGLTMSRVKFYGYFGKVASATVNGIAIGSEALNNDVDNGVLKVDFNVPMNDTIVLTLTPDI